MFSIEDDEGSNQLKIALAQMDVISNKPNKNLESMLNMIGRAKAQGVDLIAFPEMCVGGYLLSDKWQEDTFCENLMEYNEILNEASNGIAIAYGNIYVDKYISKRVNDDSFHPNKDGRSRKYNSVYVFQDGNPVSRLRETKILPPGIQPKSLLPNYRIFDDERYFFSTQDIAKDFGVPLESLLQPLLVRTDREEVPIGFELCEDLWCNDYRRNCQALNPTKILIQNGSKIIINSSASPWTFGKNEARDRRIEFLKEESGNDFVPFLYVNCVGAQNNGKNIVTFDGASTVYNSDGVPVILANTNYEEQLLVVNASEISKWPTVQRIKEGKIERKFRAIVRGIRHMNDILGHVPHCVIGLSGGIDSGVVASLLTIAFGSQNVTAVNMPTKYNTEETKESARYIAEKLGVQYLVIPISKLVEFNRLILTTHTDTQTLDMVLEQNIQAKVRMQILSNLAQKFNGIYINNGNKWETATGYCTLDGDARGAIAPVGDLTKSEIIQMAIYLNEDIFHKEIIPQSLIDLKILPGAELEYLQENPLKLGYHCALIEMFMDYNAKSANDIMQWYLDGSLEENLGITTSILRFYNMDNPVEFTKDLEWFIGQIERSVFKRIQGQPIILLTKTGYGYDRRESILPEDTVRSTTYKKLKMQILSMGIYKSRKVWQSMSA
jgi:NAD+ synthase (glutamine-hydrolysing)